MVIQSALPTEVQTKLGREVMVEPSNVKLTYLTEQLRETKEDQEELDEIQATVLTQNIFLSGKRAQATSLNPWAAFKIRSENV